MNEVNFEERLLEIAHADDDVTNKLPALEARRKEIYDVILAELDAQIDAMKSKPEQLRKQLRDDAMSYVQETGDVTPHERITVRRKTKWMYDKDIALEWSKVNKPDLVLIKESLKVRPFEKALGNGLDFDAEQVPAPEIVIPTKLGDLLITHGKEIEPAE